MPEGVRLYSNDAVTAEHSVSSVKHCTRAARVEQLITAAGLSIALGGLLSVCASAFGLVDGAAFWECWLISAGLILLSARRLSHALAPLFRSQALHRHALTSAESASAHPTTSPRYWSAGIRSLTTSGAAEAVSTAQPRDGPEIVRATRL